MKKFTFFAGLIFVAGCTITGGNRLTDRAVVPLRCATKQVANNRAQKLAKALSPMSIRAVALAPRAWLKDYSPAEVVARISAYGFNRIYIKIDGVECFQGDEGENLAKFAQSAAANKIPLELVFYPRDYAKKHRGNRFVRNLIYDYPSLHEAVEIALKWNQLLNEKSSISGITVALEPHLFSAVNDQLIQRQTLVWSEKTYGANLDNDLLMKQALSEIKGLSSLPSLPPLSVATTDFFHQLVKEKKLSAGSIEDCAKLGDKVIIFNQGNKPSELISRVANALSSAPENKVVLWIELAKHSSNSHNGLRRRDWNDLLRAINYAVKEYQKYPASAGVVLGPLTILEFMRQERD